MADKDWWDKAEVVGKVGGAIVIPIVVGVTAAILNSQISKRDQTARMSQIAIGILTEPAEKDTASALRDWAIDVLVNPTDPPPLSEEAALALRTERLKFGDWSNLYSAQPIMSREICLDSVGELLGDRSEEFCSQFPSYDLKTMIGQMKALGVVPAEPIDQTPSQE